MMTVNIHMWTWYVVGGVETDEGAVSEGFTFAEALMRANLLSETVLEEGVGSSELPLC